MTEREGLDATLVATEATISRAVIMSAEAGTSWAEMQRKFDIVRPHCRELRKALAELDNAGTSRNADRARAVCRELRAVLRELSPATRIPFRCDQPSCSLLESPRTTCWLNTLQRLTAAHPQVRGSAATLAEAAASLSDRPTAAATAVDPPHSAVALRRRVPPALLRQAVSLLALVLAYLNYYLIDVQLLILCLPAVFP